MTTPNSGSDPINDSIQTLSPLPIQRAPESVESRDSRLLQMLIPPLLPFYKEELEVQEDKSIIVRDHLARWGQGQD